MRLNNLSRFEVGALVITDGRRAREGARYGFTESAQGRDYCTKYKKKNLQYVAHNVYEQTDGRACTLEITKSALQLVGRVA